MNIISLKVNFGQICIKQKAGVQFANLKLTAPKVADYIVSRIPSTGLFVCLDVKSWAFQVSL